MFLLFIKNQITGTEGKMWIICYGIGAKTGNVFSSYSCNEKRHKSYNCKNKPKVCISENECAHIRMPEELLLHTFGTYFVSTERLDYTKIPCIHSKWCKYLKVIITVCAPISLSSKPVKNYVIPSLYIRTFQKTRKKLKCFP